MYAIGQGKQSRFSWTKVQLAPISTKTMTFYKLVGRPMNNELNMKPEVFLGLQLGTLAAHTYTHTQDMLRHTETNTQFISEYSP